MAGTLSGQESAQPPVSFQNPGNSLHLSEPQSTGLQIRIRMDRKSHSSYSLTFTDSVLQKREVQSQDCKGRQGNVGAPEVEGNIRVSIPVCLGARSLTNLSQIEFLSSAGYVSLGKSLQHSGLHFLRL